MKKKRYSNYDPLELDVFGAQTSAGIAANQANSGFVPSSGAGSGWTSQNTVDVINTGAGALTTILTAIFGRNNVQQANYATEMYRQEQRTNTILWVVIGLVLALIVFLVIRKTK